MAHAHQDHEGPPAAPPGRRPRARLLIGGAVSLAAILLAARGVDMAGVGAALAGARPELVALALLSVMANNLAKAERWRWLMGPAGRRVGLGPALRLHLIGQMLNSVLPARVGDLSRVYMADQVGLPRAFVLGTVALEKLIDLACYGLLLLLLLALMPLPGWAAGPAAGLALAGAVALAVAVALALALRRGAAPPAWVWRALPGGLRRRAQGLLGQALASLRVVGDGRASLALALWSLAVWASAALTNLFVQLALGISAPPAASLFVLLVLLAGISIPSVPGRIGVFQYLCILALAVFGVGQAAALGYGLLLHALTYLPMIGGGLLALWVGGRPPRPAAEPER